MEWYWWVVIFIGVVIFVNHQIDKAKRAKLMRKYNDEALVENIMNRMFWLGQTKEQLIDSLGNPGDIDTKVLKTKTKEVWKYNETGKNRFSLKITIENGEVVGWDKK